MRLIFFVLMTSLLFSGCVSKSRYLEQVGEAERMSESLEDLTARNQDLASRLAESRDEKITLTQTLEEVSATAAALQQDLVRARADIDRLETVLSARSEEAGKAMSDMRRTIDRLQGENRELAAQVERERLAREARIAQMKTTYDELVGKMEEEIERGEITISELQGKLTVNMVERILFDTAQAEIKPAGLEVLQRVGNILKEVEDKDIRIEGHTDNVPISSRLQERFPSNWELSTARANNVVHFLQKEVGIPGQRLSAAGYGEYRPLADNGTPEGRTQNRRIQIVLVPTELQAVEE